MSANNVIGGPTMNLALYRFLILSLLIPVFSLSLASSSAESIRDKLSKDASVASFVDRNGERIDPDNFEQLDFLKSDSIPNQPKINLTIDITVSKILDDEIRAGIQKYSAIGGGGILMDASTGEIIAISSQYTSYWNTKWNADATARFNMITEGLYETGSTAKLLTIANAYDGGFATAETKLDARKPLKMGKYEIGDYHATNRILTVDEAFINSSNIATARLALKVGTDNQANFLNKIGYYQPSEIKYMEVAQPLYPRQRSRLMTATTAFGHGIAVTPLQSVTAMSALVNGGYLVQPSIIKDLSDRPRTQVISPETSAYVRHLMEMSVDRGSGMKARVDGISIGGSTSTAEKSYNGDYMRDKLLTSFIAVFPIDKPRYVLMTLFDEPQPLPGTHGYATAGWNAAPVAGNVVKRLMPVLKLD